MSRLSTWKRHFRKALNLYPDLPRCVGQVAEVMLEYINRDHFEDTDELLAWPSKARIMDEAKLSHASVARGRAKLYEIGAVKIVAGLGGRPKAGAKPDETTARYRFVLDWPLQVIAAIRDGKGSTGLDPLRADKGSPTVDPLSGVKGSQLSRKGSQKSPKRVSTLRPEPFEEPIEKRNPPSPRSRGGTGAAAFATAPGAETAPGAALADGSAPAAASASRNHEKTAANTNKPKPSMTEERIIRMATMAAHAAGQEFATLDQIEAVRQAVAAHRIAVLDMERAAKPNPYNTKRRSFARVIERACQIAYDRRDIVGGLTAGSIH